MSHHIAPNSGNWMHIHYATSLQARKALSRNGKILPGNIMIGVVPCIDVVSILVYFSSQADLPLLEKEVVGFLTPWGVVGAPFHAEFLRH